MKIVFDTNVILSALITQGLSSRVLDICINIHQLFISQWILDEVLEKLERKIHVPDSEFKRINIFLDSIFYIVNPSGNCPDICREKDDNNLMQI